MNKMRFLLAAISLIILTGIFTKSYSQCIPDTTLTDPLFMSDNSLDCFVNNQTTNLTIYLRNWEQISGIMMHRLRIDSLTNLPCGLGYALNKDSRTYGTAEVGCILLSGIPRDSVGRYTLHIYVSIDLDADTSDWSFKGQELGSLCNPYTCPYYVQLKDRANDSCPPVDSLTSNLTASCKTLDFTSTGDLYEPAPELINIYPNPNDGIFTIELNQASGAIKSLEVLDLMGRLVYKENSVRGPVTKVIDLQDQPEGIYILRLVGDRAIKSKRIMIYKE